jgi:hypothetical protein
MWVAIDGILDRHFCLLKLEFLSGFLPTFFPFYKMLFMNRLEFFC